MKIQPIKTYGCSESSDHISEEALERNEVKTLLKYKQAAFIMFLHYITEKHLLNCPFMLSSQLPHEVVLCPLYRGGN